jgi:replicative DNA helicase
MATTDAYVPPQNLDAEESVLGAMMVSEAALVSVIVDVHLGAEDFYRERHRVIYKAIEALQRKGEPVDALTVTEQLTQLGELAEAGGKELVSSLASTVPVPGNAEHYAKIVKANAMLRRLLATSQRIQKSVHERENEPRDLVEQAERWLFEVAHDTSAQDFASLTEILERETTRLEELSEGRRDLTGTPSGFIDLDSITGGFQPGNLVVVAARPAMGKCLAGSSLIYDPATGARNRLDDLYARAQAGAQVRVASMGADMQLTAARATAIARNEPKPTWRVTTRLGRSITATANHPLLTIQGWRRVDQLRPGDRIGVPRTLPSEAAGEMADAEVVLLAALIADGNLTNFTPRFCFGEGSAVLPEIEQAVAALGGRTRDDGHGNLSLSAADRKLGNPVTALLRSHGLMGLKSAEKFVPDAIFGLSHSQVARFLGILFACDGHVHANDRLCQAGYTTISERLARDVQHLLLRLGIVGKIRTLKRDVYEGTDTVAREVRITGQGDLLTLCRLLRIPGKELQQARVLERVEPLSAYTNVDTVPSEVWSRVLAAKGAERWAEVSARLGRPRNHNWHVGTRGLSRALLGELAGALQDDALMQLANSDVWWDEVASIEEAGIQETYDLQVPVHECFVADDVIVHNSAIVANMADFVAVDKNESVALFSLEMSETELAHRFLACRAGIRGDLLRKGKVKNLWPKVLRASNQLENAPIWIDTSSDLSVLELRAKARRLHSREGGLGLIIVDYIQLMRSDDPRANRVEQVGQISRGLKLLAGELGVPVIALSQLSRAPELRPDKRPILSDLRESGNIEQDADVVCFLFRQEYYDGAEADEDVKGKAEVIIAKHRNGPIGMVELAFQSPYPRFRNLARADRERGQSGPPAPASAPPSGDFDVDDALSDIGDEDDF